MSFVKKFPTESPSIKQVENRVKNWRTWTYTFVLESTFKDLNIALGDSWTMVQQRVLTLYTITLTLMSVFEGRVIK